MARHTAFRAYGDFRLKISGKPDIPEKSFGRGCIEVLLEEIEGTAECRAIFRWEPENSSSDKVSAEALHFPNLTRTELDSALGNGDSPVEFRLDAKHGAPLTKSKLYCRGAALLQEFTKGGQDTPHLNLPVLPRYEWQGTAHQSEVIFGDEKDSSEGASFTFRLALFTPRPQCGAAAKGTLTYSLPITLRYDPKTPAEHDRCLVHYAGVGPEGVKNSEPVDLDKITKIKRRALGKFGFSRTDGDEAFLYWPRTTSSTERNAFWPIDDRAFLSEVLERFCTPHPKFLEHVSLAPPEAVLAPGGQPEEISEYGHRWNSIGFSAPGDESTNRGDTIVNYRTALFANAGHGTQEDSGDLNVRKDTADGTAFLIRDPSNPNKWIDTQSTTLFIDLEIRYPRPDDPWSIVSNLYAAKPSITLRIGYDTEIKDNVDGLSVTRRTVTTSQLLSDVIRGARRARLDVGNIHATEPQSFSPEIDLEPAASSRYRMAFSGELVRAAVANGGWQGRTLRRQHWHGVDPHYSLWPGDKFRFIPGKGQSGENRLNGRLAFPGFSSRENVWAAIDLQHAGLDDDFFASFEIAPRDSADGEIEGRLGGLEFRISAALPQRDQQPHVWSFGRRNQPADYPSASARIAASEHRFHLWFNVLSMTPRGGDVDERSDRPRPILINADVPSGEVDLAASPYTMEIEERCSSRDDRRLYARLRVGSGAPAGRSRFVLLSEQPFSVMRFTSRPPKDYGGQQDQSLAEYDSDARRWQFKLIDDHFHYELQAQAVGESMDRPQRLEILDPEAPNPPPAEHVFPPCHASEEGDVLRRHAIEFRLTPSTELWVKPTDLRRNFYFPEWSTYQLFRDYGPLGLGVSLNALRGEFLYGMPVSIDAALEEGPSRTARVAEIEALLGTILGKLDPEYDDDLEKRWNGVRRAVSSRSERLELWMRDASASRALAPARFAKGVRYALRDTAIYRSPFGDDEPGLALIDDSAAAAASEGRFRLAKYGLPGGAIWPLESINFCKRLRDRPESSGGTIEKIALSPLGGDADQRAEFLNGQVAIISETRNGHVQRHRVEIIGRISVLWHRAKHVVVYERATSPSAQFTPEETRDTKPERSRRPILRKVSEYIELLQPVRSYPDTPAATASSVGFLRSVRFNSTKINVDSAWSEELGDFGWRIPLWDRASARQRPSVYPRPDIAFITSSEGDDEDPVVAQECLDPDNIFFFADASQGNAETDSWPPRPGLDYANLPEPTAEQQPDAASEADKKPSASRIPRGHRPYTWRLGPTSRKTAINAGFSEEPLFAGLETITFMRATRQPGADTAGEAVSDAMKAMNGIAAATPEIAERAVVDTQLALNHAIANNDKPGARTAAGQLAEKLKGLATTARAYSTALGTKKETFHAKLGIGADPCAKMIGDFSASIQRRKLLFLSQINDWVADERRKLPTFPDYGTFIDKQADKARKALEPSLPNASEYVDRADRALQQALDCVRDLEVDVFQTLDKAVTDVERVRTEYDKAKPWSPARIEEYHRRVTEVRDGVVGDLTTAVTEIQARLATELDAVANQIATAVGAELRRAIVAKDGVLSAIRTAEKAALGLLLSVAAKLRDPIVKYVAELKATIKRVEERDTEHKYDEVFQNLRSTLEKLEIALTTAEKAISDTAAQVEATGLDVKRVIELAAEQLKQLEAQIVETVAVVRTEASKIADNDLDHGKRELLKIIAALEQESHNAIDSFADHGEWVDDAVGRIVEQLRTARRKAENFAAKAIEEARTALDGITAKLNDFRTATSPDKVAELVQATVIKPALELAISREDYDLVKADLVEWQRRLDSLLTIVQQRLNSLDATASEKLSEIEKLAKDACRDLATGLDDIFRSVGGLAEKISTWADPLAQKLAAAGDNLAVLQALSQSLEKDWETQSKQFEQSYAQVTAYADRVFDEAGKLTSGGLAAAPSNILRLYAAAASAPALPNLDFARERLGYYYSELNKVIDTTPVEAWFGRLGDELKAMGLSLPFSKIGDGIIPDDLSKFDIGRVLRNFGGLDLSRLFSGYKLPAGAKDAIKITHAFDKKLFRAWVQINVDLPMPGRKALFAIGPFQLDLVDSRLVGLLRLEASKDTDRVEQTGQASLATNIDAIVSGQSMVMLRQVSVKYDRRSGLDVEFDPKNIRLNPAFRFIQETFAKLFPEELGGLKIVKKDGIPVGVEHEFSMPPVSLMAGTSGVSNIQISNSFGLIAYPDFMISNRFALSKPDMPFLFSIFIIGGTGYIIVDCFYRPFGKELTVIVEAAAGGSAALGFAIGPVSGSVFITLSIALKYRKTSGQSGALTASLVLLIAGNVDVARVATVYIALLLRMAYHENGQIDGVGTLSVTVRISRFFKIKVRRQVNYKLRSASSSSNKSPDDTARELIEARG